MRKLEKKFFPKEKKLLLLNKKFEKKSKPRLRDEFKKNKFIIKIL
jgi:hypothetical protein